MEVVLHRGDVGARPAGALALGILEDERPLEGAAAPADRGSRGAIKALLERGDFRGRFLEVITLYPPGLRAARLILVGLGRRAELAEHRVRQGAGAAARRARELSAGTLATVLPGAGRGGIPPERAAQAVAEGVILGSYRFTAYRGDEGSRPLKRVEIVERDTALARGLAPAVARGAAWAGAACLARDLASTPGDDLTPDGLAERAQEIARSSGARIQVLGVPQLEKHGMGALLGVGRGSVHPPRFLVLERDPGAAPRRGAGRETVVLVGKGV